MMYRAKGTPTFRTSHANSQSLPLRNENRPSHKIPYANVHNNFIKLPQTGNDKLSTNWCMDNKINDIYPSNGTLFRNIQEIVIDDSKWIDFESITLSEEKFLSKKHIYLFFG